MMVRFMLGVSRQEDGHLLDISTDGVEGAELMLMAACVGPCCGFREKVSRGTDMTPGAVIRNHLLRYALKGTHWEFMEAESHIRPLTKALQQDPVGRLNFMKSVIALGAAIDAEEDFLEEVHVNDAVELS